MAFQLQEVKSENLENEFDTVTVCGATLPKLTKLNDFPYSLRKRAVSLLSTYRNTVVESSKKAKEDFTEDEEVRADLYVLRMFALWSQHPFVADEDRVKFEGENGLKEKYEKGQIYDEDMMNIAKAVGELTVTFFKSLAEGADSPKAKRVKRSRSSTSSLKS
jgi:hypothetical protein